MDSYVYVDSFELWIRLKIDDKSMFKQYFEVELGLYEYNIHVYTYYVSRFIIEIWREL